MMTVGDVIEVVRKRLGDPSREAWSDDQLITYVGLCQQDICVFTHFYRKTYALPIYENVVVYNLPKDFYKLHRVEYNCKEIPLESRKTIDKGEAVFPCIIKDNLQYNQLEVRMSEEDCNLTLNVLENAFGVVTFDDSGIGVDDKYGVVTHVTDEYNPPPPMSKPIGYFAVYYSAVPPLPSSLNDELVLPDIWLSAFLHYVSGYALQDDNDANNVERGELEIGKYMRLLDKIFKTTAKDSTSSIASKLDTSYRRF
jgi:hypothetical protein